MRLDPDDLRPSLSIRKVRRLVDDPDPLVLYRSELSEPLLSEDGSLVFAGTSDGVLHAIWVETGKPLFARPLGTFGAAMIQRRDTLWVGVDTRVVGLEAYSGEVKTSIDVGGVVGGNFAIHRGTAIVPIQPSSVLAIDLERGAVTWRHKEPKPEGITIRGQSSPVIDARRGLVYVGFDSGAILAADLGTGEVKWRRATGKRGEAFADVDAGPVLSADAQILYAAAYNGGLVGLKPSDGTVLFERPDLGRLTSLEAADGLLTAVHGDGQVLGLSREGHVLWRYRVKSGVPGKPRSIGSGQVLVPATRGALAVLDAHSGRPLQVLRTGIQGTTAPASVRGDDVAILTNAGSLILLRRGSQAGLDL